jgi:hypothetical protein
VPQPIHNALKFDKYLLLLEVIYSAFLFVFRGKILVAAWFKALVCGRLLAGIPGSNPAGGMGVSVVCFTVKGESTSQDNQYKETSAE